MGHDKNSLYDWILFKLAAFQGGFFVSKKLSHCTKVHKDWCWRGACPSEADNFLLLKLGCEGG
jgi:hypothetical protein